MLVTFHPFVLQEIIPQNHFTPSFFRKPSLKTISPRPFSKNHPIKPFHPFLFQETIQQNYFKHSQKTV